jgi:Trypsin-co-occurring domain 2
VVRYQGVAVEGVDLDVVLEELRAQFGAAAVAAAGSAVQFPVQSVTVELKVGLTRTRDGKAGFKVPFIGAELGASGGSQRQEFQTITVVFGSPVDENGGPIKVAHASEQKPG